LRKHLVSSLSFAHRSLLHRTFLVACLYVLCTIFLLAAPIAHAASSSARSSSRPIELTPQNFRQYVHHLVPRPSTSPDLSRVVFNGIGPGAYQFTDSILSLGNNFYVAAELGSDYPGDNHGMLRARTSGTALGTWELFDWYWNATVQRWFIYSEGAGLFVSEEQQFGGGLYDMLRARTGAYSLGTWEEWNVVTLQAGPGTGVWPIIPNCEMNTTNGDFTVLEATNGLVVTPELGYSGSYYAMLRARTPFDQIGTWERFCL
jgi:hypothetical protein